MYSSSPREIHNVTLFHQAQRHQGSPYEATWLNRCYGPLVHHCRRNLGRNRLLFFIPSGSTGVIYSYIFALLLQLAPLRNSGPGSHSGQFSPLPTTYGAVTLCCISFAFRRLIRSYGGIYEYVVGRGRALRVHVLGPFVISVNIFILFSEVRNLVEKSRPAAHLDVHVAYLSGDFIHDRSAIFGGHQ